MDMLKLFHMKGGIGSSSYATNSLLQRAGISMMRPVVEEAISDLCRTTAHFPETLSMADLGCSSGPNTLLVASVLTKAVEKISLERGCKSPEILMHLNDLPGNDFNTIFLSLPEFQENMAKEKTDDSCFPPPCYFSGVPGSFFGRLFPTKSLHFAHSSYSLQWLSQFPQVDEINRGNIYLSNSTPQSVVKAYYEQFQKDFSLFLKCRSEEMVPGGRMVLLLSGRRSDNPCSKESCQIWGLFAEALNDMVSEGLVEEEKLDSFNLPQYAASATEIMNLVEKEGSFIINHLEISDVNWRTWKANDTAGNKELMQDGGGHDVAKGIRAGIEPLVATHFGEAILDEVFMRYETILADEMSRDRDHKSAFVTITISLIRKS